MKKIRPSLKKVSLNFLLWDVILAAIIFLCLLNVFVFRAWDYVQWIIIGGYLLASIILYFVMYKTTYYVIDKKSFSYFCLGKESVFSYQNIRFVEAKQGKKSGTLGLYLTPTYVRYLTADKDGILYDTLMKKCNQQNDENNLKEPKKNK